MIVKLTSDGTTHDIGTTMTLTIDGPEVRQVFRDLDGEILSDDIAFTGSEEASREWVRKAVIDYRADGWTEE